MTTPDTPIHVALSLIRITTIRSVGFTMDQPTPKSETRPLVVPQDINYTAVVSCIILSSWVADTPARLSLWIWRIAVALCEIIPKTTTDE